MGAPLTIEQIILNHNIGVNISDAETLAGHTVDYFAKAKHEHTADDITSGVVNPNRLPDASPTAKGAVTLSSSTSSTADDLAATASAVNAVRHMAEGSASASHRHSPSDINGGAFTDVMKAQNNNKYGVGQLRNVHVSTSDPSNLVGENGDIYIKYK